MDSERAEALRYLREHHVMTLATGGAHGPWAAAVFYVNDGFELYFLSAPTTRHCADLAADPRVAATVQEDYADWPAIRGVQLEGHARPVDETELPRVKALYGAKFPLVGRIAQAPDFIVAALARVRWYHLAPAAVHYIDNSRGFGHRSLVLARTLPA